MATAEIVSHNGCKWELRHSKLAFVQRHAGEDMEKDFLTMILNAKGVPVRMISAMEVLSLQNAACGLALRTNGPLKHPAFCAQGRHAAAEGSLWQVYARTPSVTILDTKGVPVRMSGAMEGRSLQNAACGLAPRTNGQLKHLAFCAYGVHAAAEGSLCPVYARTPSATEWRTLGQSSARSFVPQSQPRAWCAELISMATAEIVSHNGRKWELRHFKRAFVQRHGGEVMEKDFLTTILDSKGAPVLMIGAMEGLSLQNAACGLALRTNGQLKHLGHCAQGRRAAAEGSLCQVYMRTAAFRYPSADIVAKLSQVLRTTIAALCVVHESYQHGRGRGRLPQWPQVGAHA